mgnify:CR=1 FL=1
MLKPSYFYSFGGLAGWAMAWGLGRWRGGGLQRRPGALTYAACAHAMSLCQLCVPMCAALRRSSILACSYISSLHTDKLFAIHQSPQPRPQNAHLSSRRPRRAFSRPQAANFRHSNTTMNITNSDALDVMVAMGRKSLEQGKVRAAACLCERELIHSCLTPIVRLERRGA